jgi:hypothetical protein
MIPMHTLAHFAGPGLLLLVASCVSSAPVSYDTLPPTQELVAPSQVATQEAGAPMPAGWAEFQNEYRPEGPQEGDYEATVAAVGSSSKDFDTGGFNLAGSFGKFLTDRNQLLVRQGLQFSDFGSSQWNGSTRIAWNYHLLEDRFRPVVGANFGWVYGDSVKETLAAAPELGFKWYLSSTAFLSFLAEYRFFFDSASDATDAFDDGQFAYSLGFGYRF